MYENTPERPPFGQFIGTAGRAGRQATRHSHSHSNLGQSPTLNNPMSSDKVALFAPARLDAAAIGIRARDHNALAAFAADVSSVDSDNGAQRCASVPSVKTARCC
jgi:hypothetical protein